MGNHCFMTQFKLVEIFILMQKLKQHCMCYIHKAAITRLDVERGNQFWQFSAALLQ